MVILKEPISFEWDAGNEQKSYRKHKVGNQECEEVFFDPDRKILKDVVHSQNEERYLLIGETKHKRLLFIVFMLRNQKVRVISARDINKKERTLYEKTA